MEYELKIEAKVYDQIKKGISNHEDKMQPATLAYLIDFVRNANLVPVDNLAIKVEVALDKMRALNEVMKNMDGHYKLKKHLTFNDKQGPSLSTSRGTKRKAESLQLGKLKEMKTFSGIEMTEHVELSLPYDAELCAGAGSYNENHDYLEESTEDDILFSTELSQRDESSTKTEYEPEQEEDQASEERGELEPWELDRNATLDESDVEALQQSEGEADEQSKSSAEEQSEAVVQTDDVPYYRKLVFENQTRKFEEHDHSLL